VLRQWRTSASNSLAAGTHQLAFADGRKAVLHVPPDAGDAGRLLHLLLLLHGAGGQHGGGDHIALAHAIRHGARR
jgi:poly(3-hydroxybutyrate) depolymerase